MELKNKLLTQLILIDSISKKEDVISYFDKKYSLIKNQTVNEIIKENKIPVDLINSVFDNNKVSYNEFNNIYKNINKIAKEFPEIKLNDVDLHSLFLSSIAYEQPTAAKNILLGFDYEEITFANTKNTHAIMCKKDNTIYISFKGSQKLSDWLKINLQFWYDNIDSLKYHKGFARETAIFLPQIKEYIEKNKTDDVKVVYTGHSMGGALATLISLYESPDVLVTFGSPKVANGKEYRIHFNSFISKRYVNDNDFISNLPLSIRSLEYKHLSHPDILDTQTHAFNILENHSIKKYFKTLIEKKLLTENFSTYFMSNLLNVDNFSLLKSIGKKEYSNIKDKIYKHSVDKNIGIDDAVDLVFKEHFNLNNEDFDLYKKSITNKTFSNLSFDVLDGFTNNKFSKTLKQYFYHFKAYRNIKNHTEKTFNGHLDKLISTIGNFMQLSFTFLKTGDISLFKTAIKSYLSNKKTIDIDVIDKFNFHQKSRKLKNRI